MSKRHLFVDLEEVEATHNVVQRVVDTTKHQANPLLPLGDLGEWDSLQARPWEGRTVLYDAEDRLFKCWYAGSDLTNERWWALGYAVSEDGVRWEKPHLGLFEYNGNTRNNICCMAYGTRMWSPVRSRCEWAPAPLKRSVATPTWPPGWFAACARVSVTVFRSLSNDLVSRPPGRDASWGLHYGQRTRAIALMNDPPHQSTTSIAVGREGQPPKAKRATPARAAQV